MDRQLFDMKVGEKYGSDGNGPSFKKLSLLSVKGWCWTVLLVVGKDCCCSVGSVYSVPTLLHTVDTSMVSGLGNGDNRSVREIFSGEDNTEFSPLFDSFVSSQISLLMQLAVELDEELEEVGA